MRRLHEVTNGEVLTKASVKSFYAGRVCASFRLFDHVKGQNERTNKRVRVWVYHQKKSSPFRAASVHQLLSTVELDREVSNLLRLSSALNRASWDTSDSELVPNANRVVAARIRI
jgi:hypothetical protein